MTTHVTITLPLGVMSETVGGLLGAHPRIVGSAIALRLDETLAVPAGSAPTWCRRTGTTSAAVMPWWSRSRLRLEEYRPRVMNAFVRNRLLDEVYLPLIGDNLARQLGATGDAKRVDQMGLLLLISPPGYGKTTLMEYVASRPGLRQGQRASLGSAVTSLAPADAPDATARQEVEKISFALELATTSFAVCMAGNPYTESGQRFRVPDMLANRADRRLRPTAGQP